MQASARVMFPEKMLEAQLKFFTQNAPTGIEIVILDMRLCLPPLEDLRKIS